MNGDEVDTRDAEPACDTFTPAPEGRWCTSCGWAKTDHRPTEEHEA